MDLPLPFGQYEVSESWLLYLLVVILDQFADLTQTERQSYIKSCNSFIVISLFVYK